MAQAGKTQDKLLNKRSMLLETSQQKQKLIRELGSLPRKELDDYKGLSEKQLLASLKAVNEQLKEFSGRLHATLLLLLLLLFFLLILPLLAVLLLLVV